MNNGNLTNPGVITNFDSLSDNVGRALHGVHQRTITRLPLDLIGYVYTPVQSRENSYESKLTSPVEENVFEQL